MTKCLVEKGDLETPLILWNRTQKRAENHAAQLGADKTRVLGSVEEVVKEADIIFTCLGDDPAVLGIMETMLACDVQGKLFVDCSTVHPDTTEKLEKSVTAKGAEFVGMPGLLPSNFNVWHVG